MSSLQLANLHNCTPSYDFPPPHSMCSPEECAQREQDYEISEFECTSSTHAQTPTLRRIDPALAVSKYRRSAAGTTFFRPPRTLKNLETVWTHLQYILYHQAVHPGQAKRSLLYTLSFLEDRIRALQVDLVVSQYAAPQLQLQLTRFHILELYMTCQAPKMEAKFIQQALWTSLASYWKDPSGRYHPHDDQVLCWTVLCHVSNALLSSGTEGYSSILQQSYRQYASKQHAQNYPEFNTALAICSAAHAGYYRNVMLLLTNASITCRLCMAPALFQLRWNMLRQYNGAFMKLSKISGDEMARLLFLPNAKAALDFCVACGIPCLEGTTLLLKSVVSLTPPPPGSWNDNQNNDDFIFGPSMTMERDEDGIMIPSAGLIEKIIMNEKC